LAQSKSAMLIQEKSIQSILKKCSKDGVNVIFIAENTPLNIEDLIKEANTQNIPIAGGIFPMILHDDCYLDDGIILKRFQTAKEAVIIKNLNQYGLEVQLPELTENINSCIILLDGLMKNISVFLDRIYEEYWKNINYIGAGCGTISLIQKPCVFTNEGLFENAGILILIESEINLGVKHGWEKFSGPFIANKVEGNKIIELNWRPAFEIYKEEVEKHSGQNITIDNFFDISKAYPFGIYREGKEDIVRDPLSVNEDGSLTCIGEVGANVALNILNGDKASLIASAQAASQLAMNDIEPIDVFVVDCITRVLYLEHEFSRELAEIKKMLNSKRNPQILEGVLSLGEISTDKGGFLELYNKTIVVSAMYHI
jgi:hypothetical protein